MTTLSTRPDLRTVRRTTLAAALSTAVIGLAGCGTSSSTGAQSTANNPTHSPSPHTSHSGMTMPMITIKNFTFSGPSSVTPGASVMVTNQDPEAHTITADTAGGFNIKIDPGKSVTFTAPSKPGNYPYHCTFHSNMHGTLSVN
jgi:plastocyanin